MSALPTIRTQDAPSIADVALERLPQHLMGDTAWAHSATRHCTRELLDAIEGNRTFRIDRIIRALATTPSVDQIEAVFHGVCDAIVANAYQKKSGNLRATLMAVEKAQNAAGSTLKALRTGESHESATPDNIAAVVTQFSRLVAASDPEGAAHSEACAALAVKVAKKLGLDDATVARCERAARLQHIGAMALSHLRSKSEPLDEREKQAILDHPEAGAKFCASVPEIADLAPIIAAHHEYFDGTGYLRGLRGSEIPIEARVIGVVDAFLAMTGQRAYRKTKDVFEAIETIEKSSGAQFDPSVVAAFLAALGHRSYVATA